MSPELVFKDDGLIIDLMTGTVFEAANCVYAPRESELYSKLAELKVEDYDWDTFKLLDYRELYFQVTR